MTHRRMIQMLKRGSRPQKAAAATPLNQYPIDAFKALVERIVWEIIEEVDNE